MVKLRWEKSIVSLWWNKLTQRPYDALITSDKVVLSLDDKPVASVMLKPPVGVETFDDRMVRTLKTAMDQTPANGQSANIWLSLSMVSLAVVDIDVRAMSTANILATLKAYWQDVLDVPAATLALTYQVQTDGRSIVSCCSDLALIEAIHATMRSSGWTAKNIAPSVVKTFHHGRKQMRTKDYCLLIFQDKVLSIGIHLNGRWIAWTSEGCDNNDWAEFANRTRRFCRSTGLCEPLSVSVWIDAPETMGAPSLGGLNNWSLLNALPTTGLVA